MGCGVNKHVRGHIAQVLIYLSEPESSLSKVLATVTKTCTQADLTGFGSLLVQQGGKSHTCEQSLHEWLRTFFFSPNTVFVLGRLK